MALGYVNNQEDGRQTDKQVQRGDKENTGTPNHTLQCQTGKEDNNNKEQRKKLDLVNLAKKIIRSHKYLTPYLAIDNIWARYILSMTWLMSCVRSHSTINKLVCRPVSIDLAHHDQKFNHIQSSVNMYLYSFLPRTIPHWNNLCIPNLSTIDLETFKQSTAPTL